MLLSNWKLALACLAAFTANAAGAQPVEVGLRGSELVISTEGREIPRQDLARALLSLDVEGVGPVDVRIDRILTDPHRPEGDVVLYDLSVADDAGDWRAVCAPEGDGAPHAVLQPGERGRIAIYCTAGNLGKCIRLGYRPWASVEGVALEPYWQACTRMLRADYCGNDQPTTRDGMLIDIYDTLGIQEPQPTKGLHFEAAWGPEGALCVNHPRVPQHGSLKAIVSKCPRLLGRAGPACTEDRAKHLGRPLIFNASRGDGVPESR